MPTFKIGGSFGHPGTDWTDEFVGDTLEEARDAAKEHVLERVEWWAEAEEADPDAQRDDAQDRAMVDRDTAFPGTHYET